MDVYSSQNPHRQAELHRVALQAAEWLVMLEDGTDQEHEALAEWLLESPLHTRMFLRAAAIDRQAAELHPTVLQALMEQIDWEPPTNVLPLTAEPKSATPAAIPAQRKHRPSAAGLTALAASLGCMIWWYQTSGPGSWQRYLTNIGEQRSISLDDGSLIHLNTYSRVEVRFTSQGRDIRLLDGEALFTVHRDTSRPFRVYVDNATVQALGTQFNVYRRVRDARVTVIEGSVKISQPDISQEQAPKLTAGQAAIVKDGGGIEKSEQADVAQATAWRQRQLVFERASLQQIAREFNRYNRAPQLRIDARMAEEHRYTAVFDADNPQLLVQFLARDPSLQLKTRADEILIEPR